VIRKNDVIVRAVFFAGCGVNAYPKEKGQREAGL
jgi:hypothetical protein